LDKTMPASSRSALVHGDFKLDNCMFSLGGPEEMIAVLDWEMATLGDPMLDFGLTLFSWRQSDDAPLAMIPSATRSAGFPSRNRLKELYEKATGFSLDEIDYYEAFAHLKYAVIAQGIIARSEGDAMAGQDFQIPKEEVSLIAREGLTRLQGRR
jgi:aminoglycoside phosphotransferase (APT) family kinase protein